MHIIMYRWNVLLWDFLRELWSGMVFEHWGHYLHKLPSGHVYDSCINARSIFSC